MNVLVTGGAGYIGSHTCVELLNAGHQVAVIDNLCNSSAESLDRVRQITGKDFRFLRADIRDRAALDKLFAESDPFDAVIHFAALKAVGESVTTPLAYYNNNVSGAVTLCEAMAAHECRNMVFSSSATVYGDPPSVPIREDFPTLGATNPYARTKLMMEQIFRDTQFADPRWNVIVLRYFNPIGAHVSGLIGESPLGIPNNLLPFVAQVAAGRRPSLSVFGDDYPTPDGTGIRDYIHVVDLAVGHLRAIERLGAAPGFAAYNLGTGRGYSVREIIKAFEEASGQKVPCTIQPRRPGDIAEYWSDPTKAMRELGWTAKRDLRTMCEDVWRWQSMNPAGFAQAPF